MSVRKGSNIIAAYGSGSGGHADYINNQNLASEITRFYDWIGTLEEYEEQEVAELHPDWVCFITDDEEGGDSVYTKTEMDTLLNAKLNSNDTEYIAHQSTPSNEYIDLTLGASGSQYIAPADGYFSFRTILSNTGAIHIYNNNGNMGESDHGTTGDDMRVHTHVSKGDTCTVWYTNINSADTILRFVYANGSK